MFSIVIFLVSLGTRALRALCRRRAELVMENLSLRRCTSPGGEGMSPRNDIMVTLFPPPLSPTTPRVSPLLVTAARHGYVDCARVLIKGGAEVNSRDGKGRSALMEAVEWGHEDVLCLLLESGVERIDLYRALAWAEEHPLVPRSTVQLLKRASEKH